MSKVFCNTKRLLLLSFTALVVFSCSKDVENPFEEEQEQQQLSQTEVRTIVATDDLSSVADGVVQELFNAGESGKTAKTDECYQAEYTETGFTVSFQDCSVDGSEKLNGSLSVVYGKEGETHAFTVTYNNLLVGQIGINGTRSFSFGSGEEENSVEFTITSDMAITMTDGSEISEKGTKTFALVFGEEFSDGALTIKGNWTVKADGNTYNVTVTELLEANFGCDYIGKGIMLLNKNGLEVSVDFGDGSCDDIAALTYPNGAEESISLKD